MPFIFTGLIVFSFICRLQHINNPLYLEHHTFSCISDMTVGGLGAFLVFFSKKFKKLISNFPKLFLAGLYMFTLIIFFYRKEIFGHFILTMALDRLIVSITFLLIILEQNFCTNSYFKLKSFKTISKLGQYTYGLYCLHMIGILIVATLLLKFHLTESIWQVIIVEGGLSLVLTIVLAYISYQFFEKKFLQLKNKFEIIKTQNQPRFSIQNLDDKTSDNLQKQSTNFEGRN
jgi:peptidoglycan/LPS O-acetylase OafA/YrhL